MTERAADASRPEDAEPGAAQLPRLVGVGRGARPPGRPARLLAVVGRHWTVYASTLVANALPAFFEPILFLTAIGLGVGAYVDSMAGLPMAAFMGPGALAMTAMFTAAFETTYGTYVRMVYQKNYDGMLATPLTPTDVFLGEAIWCGCKGLGFTAVVLAIYLAFGAYQGWVDRVAWSTCAAVPLVGFCCSVLFAGLGLHVTALTKNLNNFNFFISGVLTPLSPFSGMVFPVADLPPVLRELAYALPLFHVTELNRLLLLGPEHCVELVWLSPVYLVVVTSLVTWSGVRGMTRRLIQ